MRRSAAFPNLNGQELGGSPEHSFNVFSTYDVTPRLSLGGGVQFVDEQISAPMPTPISEQPRRRNVSIDSYWVFDFYATYRFNEKALVRLNVFNLLDEEYISQLAEGGAQGIPGKAQHAIATFQYNF